MPLEVGIRWRSHLWSLIKAGGGSRQNEPRFDWVADRAALLFIDREPQRRLRGMMPLTEQE